MNRYKCIHCDKVVNRHSDKKWIPSYCDKTKKKMRLQLINYGCKVENCDNKHKGLGYCVRHYWQYSKYGRIIKISTKDLNEYVNYGDYYEIILYNKVPAGQEPTEKCRALIDKEDYDKVKNYKWSLIGEYVGCIKNKIKLHQLVLGKKDELQIDHINHDTLDNRKYNLRHCTHSQNGMNKKCKGYTWNKEKNKWQVQLMINYKNINLGYFKKEEDAIKARRKGEQKYYGKYAYKELNN